MWQDAGQDEAPRKATGGHSGESCRSQCRGMLAWVARPGCRGEGTERSHGRQLALGRGPGSTLDPQ